jgi:hypothetical protein
MSSVINSTDDILAKLCLTGFYWLVQHQKMNLGTEYDNHLTIFKGIIWNSPRLVGARFIMKFLNLLFTKINRNYLIKEFLNALG